MNQMIKNASDAVISRKRVNIICRILIFLLGHYTEKNAIFYLKLENLLCDTGASQNHFHCCFAAQMLHWESNVQDKYEKNKKITTQNRRKRKKEILYLVFVIRLFLIMFWGRKNRKELCSSSLLLRYSLVTWKWHRKKVQTTMRMYQNENVRHKQVFRLLNLFREQETSCITHHHVNAIFASTYRLKLIKILFFIFTSIFLTICQL